MEKITDISQLESLYGEAIPAALEKVRDQLSPRYREWIEACRFLILATVGAHGTDASPRGDVDPVVLIQDSKTLLLPDWRGNNRLDSLRNIVEDGRITLLFMVPGSNTVVRVNGTAILTADAAITEQFEQNGRHPRSVIIVTVAEVYFQCAKALMRSALWDPGVEYPQVPSAGQFIQELNSDFDAASYDADYAHSARERMW